MNGRTHIANFDSIIVTVDFTGLSDAISNVQGASRSIALSADEALAKLKSLVPKPPCHKKEMSRRRRAFAFVRKALHGMGWTKSCHGSHHKAVEQNELAPGMPSDSETVHHHHAAAPTSNHRSHNSNRPHQMTEKPKDRIPHLPSPEKIKEIRKVLLQIRTINKKLSKFESG